MRSDLLSSRRRGAVLIVVLAMLALFAVIGLSFVFYAESRATAARIYREAQDINAVPEPPDPAVASLSAMAQLIYDVNDGVANAGTFSALRGHSLARAMYGNFYEGQPNAASSSFTLNSLAYNGVGRVPTHLVGGREVVNYTWFTRQPGNPAYSPVANSIFDPERTGNRSLPTDVFNPNSRFVGKNVSSTYPDTNDMAIGLVNPITGQVITPSFHRDYLFNPATSSDPNEWVRQRSLAPPSVVPGNVDWTNTDGKLFLMRPRPAEHCYAPGVSAFPYPPKNADDTYTGDVQNLKGSVYPYLRPNGTIATDATGAPILIPKNDSVWLDTGAAVQIWNGKRIKPLFAFLVVPTNNKVNINASGNNRGPSQSHDSGMGFNATEINPLRVMSNQPYRDTEYLRIKFGQYGKNQSLFPSVAGASLPSPNGATVATFPGTYAPPIESAVDWDGGAPLNAMRMLLPGQQGSYGPIATPTTLSQSAFALAPRFVAPVNFSRFGNGEITESTNNPYFWSPYHWTTSGTTGVSYTATDLRKFHQKWADDSGTTNETGLGQLSPVSLGSMRTNTTLGILATTPTRNPANVNRFNMTTISNSFSLHSMMPQTVNYLAGAPYTQPYAWATGAPVPVAAGPNVIPDPTNPAYGTVKDNTDFNYSSIPTINLRGNNVSNLPPLDLNRKLADYRHALALTVSQQIEKNSVVVGMTTTVYAPPLGLNPANLINPLQSQANYKAWLIANGLWDSTTSAPVTSITTPQGLTIPLTAYPIPTYAAIQNTMATSIDQQKASLIAATNDRQEFARDIFARLVVATGAPAVYAPWHGYCVPLVANPTTPAEIAGQDALRYLAQLAANIVDYIDNDDIATTFVWNPDPLKVNIPNVNFPANYTTFLNAPPSLDPTNLLSGTTYIDRFVVGTEKSKLVVNEAYAELTNSEADSSNPAATSAFEIRFWLELMNPGATDNAYGNTAYSANPNTNASLFYSGGPTGQQTQLLGGPAPTPYNAYEVLLYKNGSANLSTFTNRNNQLGNPAGPPDQTIRFALGATLASSTNTTFDLAGDAAANDTARINGYVNATLRSNGVHFPQTVSPVGTKYRPDVFTNSASNPVNQGYLVLGPAIRKFASKEYDPVSFTPAKAANPTPAPGTPYMPPVYNANTAVSGRPPFEYAVTLENQLIIPGVTQTNEAGIAGTLNTINGAAPAVVLRRLANPYLPPNDPNLPYNAAQPLTTYPAYDPLMPLNPYITVDAITNVAVNDAVRVATNSNLPGATRPGVTPAPESRRSIAKRHPLGGIRTATQLAAVVTNDPAQSFFRHNGATINDPENPSSVDAYAVRNPQMPTSDPNLLLTAQASGRAGFEWMPFLDRPLINQLELLNVPACPSYQLPFLFLGGTNPTDMNNHLAAWTTHTYGATPAVTGNQSRLHRALELLRVKPWTFATPIGGRIAGKINVNLITDPNVLLALADPQSGDYFKALTSDLTPAVDGISDAVVNPASLADPSTVFGRLLAKRHLTARTMTQFDPTTSSSSQVYVPNSDDRPFRSLGTTHLSNAVGAYVTQGTSSDRTGFEDTILGRLPHTSLIGNPAIPEANRVGVFDLPNQTSEYLKKQLIRKMANNLTTTSETFEVYMTVGFFEVLNPGPYYVGLPGGYNAPILGKEVFKNAPGDLRSRYYAIVDRTNLTVDRTNLSSPTDPSKQGPKPFYLELANPMQLDTDKSSPTYGMWSLDVNHIGGNLGAALVANYDEVPGRSGSVRIEVGQYLRVGFGDHEEWVLVKNIPASTIPSPNPSNGTGRVFVSRNTGRPDVVPLHGFNTVGSNAGDFPVYPNHPVGSLVTNAQQGNPGPQPLFDPTKPQYQSVMPYFQKLD